MEEGRDCYGQPEKRSTDGWVDFHCHLDMEDFSGRREAILHRCFREEGFSRIFVIADPYREGSIRTVETLLKAYPRIYAMIAAHPHQAADYSPAVERRIRRFLAMPGAIAVGEAGLDYHYDFSPREAQRGVFESQVKIAGEAGLPLVVHSRESEFEVLEIIEKMSFDGPVVFHCFTGDRDAAEEILRRGGYISISGIVTFKKSGYLRDVVQSIPLDRVFTETDSPYLAPVPHRGTLNTPLNVREVAREVARIKEVSVEKLNRSVRENTDRIFDMEEKG